jgi:hypothetical protein
VLKGVIDQIADPLTGKLVVVPSNPLTADAQGKVSRVLPKGQSSGKVVAGWLPSGARLAMAFGTRSADLFKSSANRSPEPAVLFYVTDDDRAGEQVGRLIRTAGFEPVRAGGIEQSSRLEVGGDLHDLVVGPAQARSPLRATGQAITWHWSPAGGSLARLAVIRPSRMAVSPLRPEASAAAIPLGQSSAAQTTSGRVLPLAPATEGSGVHGAAHNGRPATGPGKIRSPSPGPRSIPQTKQSGKNGSV